jgi:hypothetical protein
MRIFKVLQQLAEDFFGLVITLQHKNNLVMELLPVTSIRKALNESGNRHMI